MIHKLIYKDREEWLKGRVPYITGTGASAIVGRNPYKTNLEYYDEKRRKITDAVPDNPFMEYGRRSEPLIREMFKLDYPDYQVEYEDNNLWTNDDYPFAAASLDGWLHDERDRSGILEIKTAEILKAQQREKWHDQIPDNYYIQVLHYMMVLDADFAILKAQLKSFSTASHTFRSSITA